MNAALPVVIDTNVLLDFWVFDDPRAHPLRAAVETGQLHCVRSTETDAELADVLQRSAFAVRLSTRKIEPAALLARWVGIARLVPRVFPAPWPCTDPMDQKFLDLASTARARMLVTKDKALLKAGRRARRQGLAIVPVAVAIVQLALQSGRC